MSRIDATVLKETVFVAIWQAVLTAVMTAVFLVIGEFDWTVLTGALLSGVTAVANFLLMGITIQSCIGLDEKDARTRMRGSQNLRMVMQLVVAIIGASLECFNIWAVLIPLFFPRIAVIIRSRFIKD